MEVQAPGQLSEGGSDVVKVTVKNTGRDITAFTIYFPVGSSLLNHTTFKSGEMSTGGTCTNPENKEVTCGGINSAATAEITLKLRAWDAGTFMYTAHFKDLVNGQAVELSDPSGKALAIEIHQEVARVNPVDARVSGRITFTAGSTILGDPQERVHISIESNIPVSFEAYPTLTVNGRDVTAGGGLSCRSDGGLPSHGYCIMDGGPATIELGSTGPTLPRGQYVLTIFVPATSAVSVWGQEATYTEWIGGPTGPRLEGNLQAVHDPKHPAVLNLSTVVTAAH